MVSVTKYNNITNNRDFDVLVVGGGHAGCEAATAAARVGARTILISSNLWKLGEMSCNPAIGGIAKGHIVREIDALGGLMPQVADKTAIQFRVLNRSKGFAVWSPRSQNDRKLYALEITQLLQDYSGLQLLEGTVSKVVTDNHNSSTSVLLADGSSISATTIVLTCGTFLNGLMHCGDRQESGGRIGEPPVTGLSGSILELGIKTGRLKTGTPPRLDGNTIDFSQTERQNGDEYPIFFSTQTLEQTLPHRPCWITHTNKQVHREIESGLDRSPLYCGRIKGIGPRYCPSIEDKIVRFPDHKRHIVFLEPEGLDTDEYYPNGLATSLPVDIQLNALRKIPGLANVEITRPGYAIEYDYFPPHQLKSNLESKIIANLFFAGQINGTSGYEEAAAQGLVAGTNAALKALGETKTLTFGRDEAYIGVLIDDLITRGTEEPYRMFTSRAEFRLKLRLDNAAARLSEKGFLFGLISKEQHTKVQSYEQHVSEIIRFLHENRIIDNGQSISLFDMLKRPNIELSSVLSHVNNTKILADDLATGESELYRRISAEVKYSGYLKRQELRVADLHRNMLKIIPDSFDFTHVKGLSAEGREKLLKIKPANLSQAANIPGMTPADLAVLLVYLKRKSG
ncbi:MAG: tRNA uridine-5-carboxymethylaminomethyl(34) synthesis enzyme MnmG [Calditrichaeota bacterium]|nr:tRNA uridine-5-carboxymethylaminomethyl(34) synthesis enzyme MnmG [Calditrichota bacterium]